VTLFKRFKNFIWDLTYLSGLLNLIDQSKGSPHCKGFVFYYHRVNPKPDWDPLHVQTSLSFFRKQVRLIHTKFTVVRMSEFFSMLQGDRSTFRKDIPAVITFDDGYQDVLNYAMPILRELNIYPTLFISSDPVFRRMPLPWDFLSEAVQSEHRTEIKRENLETLRRDYSLKTWKEKKEFVREVNQDLLARGRDLQKKTYQRLFGEKLEEIKSKLDPWYIRPEQLQECLKEGIEIGSHTASHPYLTSLPQEEWASEIGGSKREMESFLGQEISFFSYPAGRTNSVVRDFVEESGYSGALATGNKVVLLKNQDLFSVPRIGPGAIVALGEFYAKVSGIHPHWFR
jgi:peptidoglycan/xylan/chitin deacetylase (PgdA/CDA1 family)